MSWWVDGTSGVSVKPAMPSCTALLRLERIWSIWASLASAPARRNRTNGNVSRFSCHRSHPLIQAFAVSRNQDDTALQSDHCATFQPGTGAAPGSRALATSSDAAHAVGHQRDPTHCEHGYQDLPTVSQRPVVQRSQYH